MSTGRLITGMLPSESISASCLLVTHLDTDVPHPSYNLVFQFALIELHYEVQPQTGSVVL